MAARRQPSTTSLSRYARANSPGEQNRSQDFCNAFWGIGDGGVDVLFARMRGATRTMDELRSFWKERSAIEEEYAKRLAKLAKSVLGKDEIGELRNSFDTLRLETDKQAGYHLNLAQQIRTDLEGQTSAFHAKQVHHKKAYQTAIEKEFKAKQTQEAYVNKAREKYEQDCMRINSYTAQANLVQGKDLERITLKLERAQQTVQANERDFANFAKVLQDTVQKWEVDWKNFCDMCQDLEEERLEFTKDNMWAYANAVSTVCVSDDESCEKMRLALEQLEPEKDMENFVRDYGTGNLIPDPPAFVNYNAEEGLPPSSSRPSTRPANFARTSQRAARPVPPPQEEEPITNAAGVGAGNRQSEIQPEPSALTRQPTRNSTRGQTPVANGTNGINGINGHTSSGSAASASSSAPRANSFRQDANGEPIDPTAETMLKVGTNAYRVDPANDPQQQGSSYAGTSTFGPPANGRNGIDPLEQQMEELKRSVTRGASMRRPTTNGAPARKTTTGGHSGSQSLSLPASQSPAPRDYRNSAEIVVGAHPSASRPTSPNPNPPTAAFMQPRKSVSPARGPASDVEGVVTDYYQSLPGEHKQGSTSRRGSFAAPPPSQSPANSNAQHAQNLARPPSQVGHPGIGAHGSRSASPQPLSRTASPADARGSHIAPPAASAQRPVSPNPVGIVLDPSGRVAHDEMAQRYAQQQPPRHPQQQQRQQSLQGPPQPPPQQPPQPPPAQAYGAPPQRRTSYINAPPPAQGGYGVTPPPPATYTPAQPMQNGYVPAPPHAVGYAQPVVQYQPPVQQQAVYQPQPQPQGGYTGANGLQRGASVYAQERSLYPQQGPGYVQGYGRTPSPQPPMQSAPPTGQTTEEGVGILFYVKALYDYTATIDEEFDFQAGDIIAVTATPEDGWWSGELLDEERRQKGRHVFPSNFVVLF